MNALGSTLVAAACCLLANCALVPQSSESQLAMYREKVASIAKILGTECPDSSDKKREVELGQSGQLVLEIEIQKRLYETLQQQLIDCFKSKAKMDESGMRMECLSAKNYTDAWRKDQHGSDIQPYHLVKGVHSLAGYACDLNRRWKKWFRFTGDAGTRMLHICPKWKSCGTQNPYWTDDKMPLDVGKIHVITVYGVSKENCKAFTRKALVMRCSWNTDHDLIYKKTDNLVGRCKEAFCGI